MPHLPSQLSSFPLILRDYLTPSPKRGELLLNYDNNDLYFVKRSTGEVISVARSIYDKIILSRVKNNKLIVFDADKIQPPPDKYTIVPPVKDRGHNDIYYIVIGRKEYHPGEDNPLTAPTWAVKENKKFFGKQSGYVE